MAAASYYNDAPTSERTNAPISQYQSTTAGNNAQSYNQGGNAQCQGQNFQGQSTDNAGQGPDAICRFECAGLPSTMRAASMYLLHRLVVCTIVLRDEKRRDERWKRHTLLREEDV